MPKIKAVHFVGTGEHIDGTSEYQGWKFSFDKVSGTLNIYFGDTLPAWDNDSALAKWVSKNVK